ncbi:MAG: molybdate ABC transporter substrate-binding protein [Clostridia bacterium]|nr:molybdate ABC transporter substrate-binding protein [Clostridia bacterium]
MCLLRTLALVGCGQNPTTEAQKASPPQVSSNEANIELNVSAAASLQDACGELEALYESQNPQVNLIFNFAGSGTLQQQIEEGSPCDIFISAAQKQMDALAEKDLLNADSRIDLLANQLILIVPADSQVKSMEDLTNSALVKQISIGEPESVPAGSYAKEALTNMNLWNQLADKMVYAKDVTQVLTYVESSNVEAGFVYLSDTINAANIKIIDSVKPQYFTPIIYPAAVLTQTQYPEQAQAFLDFLQTSEAGKIFEVYGFNLCNE